MMQQHYFKVNGCDYNLNVVATLSFDQFVLEGKNSFSKGKSTDELKATYSVLIKQANANGIIVKEGAAINSGDSRRNSKAGNEKEH